MGAAASGTEGTASPRSVEIVHFTDPACPFAFSAEPIRQRLRWHYGAQLHWRDVMIVLTAGDRREAELLASGAPTLQRTYGMPIDPAPRSRPASCEPACRAVVAARLFAPDSAGALLRRLRVLCQAGGLLDESGLIARAALEAGLDPAQVGEWLTDTAVSDQLAADMQAARSPSPVARALGHKLSGRAGARRYSAPSYELASAGTSFSLPGFNAVEAYEAAIANLAPGLERRAVPSSAHAVLAWATEPLATAEIAMVMQADVAMVRSELAREARCIPAGADAYWSLAEAASGEETAVPPVLARAVESTRALG
jgi:predicted DsbA family dithiol-disulfide isomerase